VAYADAGTSPVQRSLRAADPARLHQVLQGEPVAVLARLLALGPWPWEDGLLQHLGSAKRSRVLALKAEVRPCAVLDEDLLADLAQRCGPLPMTAESGPGIPQQHARRDWLHWWKAMRVSLAGVRRGGWR